MLAYIGLISTLIVYLCIPHTIVYLSDVFPTFFSLYFIFTLINVPMFWLFLIVDRFRWLWCYYMFGLQSLWTISHIQTLWHHFDFSDVTITYTSPTTPILREKNIALCSLDLVRLCIPSIWLRLRSPALLDLVPHTSTSTHCVLPRHTVFYLIILCSFDYSLFYLAFYQFHSDLAWSFVTYIGLHIQTLSLIHKPLLHCTLTKNWFDQDLLTFRSL